MAWAALESIGCADEPPAACRRFGAAAPAPASAASTPARARLAVVAVAGVAPACVCGASAALYTQEPSAALVGSASTLAAAAGLAYVRKASARRATTVSGLVHRPCAAAVRTSGSAPCRGARSYVSSASSSSVRFLRRLPALRETTRRVTHGVRRSASRLKAAWREHARRILDKLRRRETV